MKKSGTSWLKRITHVVWFCGQVVFYEVMKRSGTSWLKLITHVLWFCGQVAFYEEERDIMAKAHNSCSMVLWTGGVL